MGTHVEWGRVPRDVEIVDNGSDDVEADRIDAGNFAFAVAGRRYGGGSFTWVEGTLDEMETFALRLYEQCIRKRVDLEDAQ